MELDDKLCLCFGVSKRKVVNFIRVEKPRRVGQLAECFGAGTGCGWCRRYLAELFEAAQNVDGHEGTCGGNAELPNKLPSVEDYATMRKEYMKETGRKPPTTQ